MLDDRNTRLYSWTQDRLAEMRRAAATEAQLRALHQGRQTSWLNGLANQLGGVMVVLGQRLQSYSDLPAQVKQ